MCICDHLYCVTDEFDKFLNGAGNCKLTIEAQWVIITLVAVGLLLVLAAIESGILIYLLCLLYWKCRHPNHDDRGWQIKYYIYMNKKFFETIYFICKGKSASVNQQTA